jgi:beta-glucosidase
MPVDNFSVIWTGRFIPSKSGLYRFTLKSDDGSRLFLDGKQVIDNWGNHAVREKVYEIMFTSSKEHQVKIEYYEQGGDASVMFGWTFTPENEPLKEVILSSVVLDKNKKVASEIQDKVTQLRTNKSKIFKRSRFSILTYGMQNETHTFIH